MRVIVCGGGQVGYGIAERLASEKNDVTVVDTNPKNIATIAEMLDVRGLVGHGSHPEVLAQAGADEADMLIAVTLSDEVNMIACQVGHSIFNIPTKIARIRASSYLDPRYQNVFSRDNLPVDVVISPEIEVGEMVLRRIAQPGAMDVLQFAENNIVVLAIECLEDCPVVNTPLRQLSELFPGLQAVIVGVERGSSLFITHSDDELHEGDIAYVAMPQTQIQRVLGLFGHTEREANRIIIAGGGHIGLYVAKAMKKSHHRISLKIIERNAERAAAISDQLPYASVLNGSALDQALLEEAGVADADLLVALTNEDQVNVLAGIMAKRLGAKANLVLINDQAYQEFTRTVGIDGHLNPRNVTISKILQQVRRGRIRNLQSVANGRAEIIEAEAMETSTLVGAPLSELDLPKGIRIGALYRNGEVISPTGSTRIRPGDRVVIFAMNAFVRDVEQMFRVSLEFF